MFSEHWSGVIFTREEFKIVGNVISVQCVTATPFIHSISETNLWLELIKIVGFFS